MMSIFLPLCMQFLFGYLPQIECVCVCVCLCKLRVVTGLSPLLRLQIQTERDSEIDRFLHHLHVRLELKHLFCGIAGK